MNLFVLYIYIRMSYDCENVLLCMVVWKIKDVFGSFFIFIRFFYIHIYYRKLNVDFNKLIKTVGRDRLFFRKMILNTCTHFCQQF